LPIDGSWRDTVGSAGSDSGTVRSASNSRISSGSQALVAAAAGPAGAGAAGVVPGSGVSGHNTEVGVVAAAGRRPVYMHSCGAALGRLLLPALASLQPAGDLG
jgi:hypothetical protein